MQLHESTQADILYLANHTVSRGCFKDQPDQIEHTYTLVHNDEILGIGGIKIINPTTAWAWIDASDKAWMNNRDTAMALKIVNEWMEKLVELHGIHRLQAYVEVDFEAALRTVAHLGFKPECRMKKFIGDTDAFLFTRFF